LLRFFVRGVFGRRLRIKEIGGGGEIFWGFGCRVSGFGCRVSRQRQRIKEIDGGGEVFWNFVVVL
jgi:hypothetical protein